MSIYNTTSIGPSPRAHKQDRHDYNNVSFGIPSGIWFPLSTSTKLQDKPRHKLVPKPEIAKTCPLSHPQPPVNTPQFPTVPTVHIAQSTLRSPHPKSISQVHIPKSTSQRPHPHGLDPTSLDRHLPPATAPLSILVHYPHNLSPPSTSTFEATPDTSFTRDKHYRVLKLSTSLPKLPNQEAKIYDHITKINSPHPGKALTREYYDSFDLQGPDGRHLGLVLQPMHMSLLEMMGLNPRPFDLALLKMTVTRLLLALDFLHTEARVLHGDLKTDNVMLSIEDDGMLADSAKAEVDSPTPRKQVDQSRSIYKSRKFRRPDKAKGYGLPTLCDFGESRIGASQESDPFVQPHIYRAPEVMFDMPWGSAADIWNLAGLIWDLFEGEHLFGDVFDARGGHDPFRHFALMVALIGPPPREFVRRSETTGQCFDPNGTWIASEDAVVPLLSLDSLEKQLSGEEKQLFIRFIRSMLKWLPEERSTAKQLLKDPWLL
ncbi:hypothetical protein V502_04190 [Pseudogymnoascus sp. VKM F-4520 (FW-2644)]|nr:hypothetical protein V502_04190 [Pseudogymnoascus sp. VKM F-4520 (FW-2644)]